MIASVKARMVVALHPNPDKTISIPVYNKSDYNTPDANLSPGNKPTLSIPRHTRISSGNHVLKTGVCIDNSCKAGGSLPTIEPTCTCVCVLPGLGAEVILVELAGTEGDGLGRACDALALEGVAAAVEFFVRAKSDRFAPLELLFTRGAAVLVLLLVLWDVVPVEFDFFDFELMGAAHRDRR